MSALRTLPEGYEITPGTNMAKKIQSNENTNNRPASSPKPKRAVRNDPLAAPQGEAKDSRRISVSVTSYRRRLTDPDNLVAKYFLDLCRYSGLIRDDSAKEIDFRCTQEKVRTKAEERTVITISDNDEEFKARLLHKLTI